MSDGTPSDKSVTVTFTSASARVNNLRSTMTGFFTDFNTGPGAFVERDLNTAYSQCNVPDMSASFINQQVHAHNLISSPSDRCDRGLTVIRPRATFDFTGRTGTVVFDLDGAFHRQAWYLDLLPDRGVPIDLNGHIHNEDSGGSPINVLRFRQQDQRLQLFFFGPDGEPNKIVETGWGDNDFPQMDRIGNGFAIVRNVRRPFVVKISRTFFAAFIDGIPVLNASISLPYSKAQVQFNTYSYNLQDQDMFQVVHWDNVSWRVGAGRAAFGGWDSRPPNPSHNPLPLLVVWIRRAQRTLCGCQQLQSHHPQLDPLGPRRGHLPSSHPGLDRRCQGCPSSFHRPHLGRHADWKQ